jgi:hypothetical protein
MSMLLTFTFGSLMVAFGVYVLVKGRLPWLPVEGQEQFYTLHLSWFRALNVVMGVGTVVMGLLIACLPLLNR